MTARDLRLEAIDGITAKRELARSLALPADLDVNERRYEILRAVAWASTHAKTPVYISTLLDRAVSVDRTLTLGDAPLSDIDRRQILREQLEDLASIGDLAELGKGYWVSVRGVLVEPENDAPHLFVSGIPLRILDQEIASQITFSGAARHAPASSARNLLGLPSVEFHLWSRRPATNLEAWTMQFSRSIDIVAGTATDSMEFYLPQSARRGCLQSSRWQQQISDLTGIYLYQQTVLNHWRVYGLVSVEDGVVRGTYEVDRQDARRLMFGYDLIAGNPTTAIWKESADDSAELILHNAVPAPEMRALTALAKRLPSKKFECRFVTTMYRAQVREIMDSLGVQLARK